MVVTCMFAVNLFKIRSLHLLPIFYRLNCSCGVQPIENREQVRRSNFNLDWFAVCKQFDPVLKYLIFGVESTLADPGSQIL